MWLYLYRKHTTKIQENNKWSFLCFPKYYQKWTKTDSSAAHYEQQFKSHMELTDLRKFMTLKVVKHINPVVSMKWFMKTNWNLCMDKRLMILKNLRHKNVTLMNKKSEIYGYCWPKTNFHKFFLSTDDPITGWKGYNVPQA